MKLKLLLYRSINRNQKTQRTMKDSLKNTRIAILTGQTVRKFMKLLMAEGQTVVYDRPIVKRIEDAAGNVLFSGLKYSSGWDCRVDISYVEQLKQLL